MLGSTSELFDHRIRAQFSDGVRCKPSYWSTQKWKPGGQMSRRQMWISYYYSVAFPHPNLKLWADTVHSYKTITKCKLAHAMFPPDIL